MGAVMTASIILALLTSVLSLVTTAVRKWACWNIAGQENDIGLWLMCVGTDCQPLPHVPGWLVFVRTVMVMGVIAIITTATLLIIYDNFHNIRVGKAAVYSYIFAAVAFFLGVSVYGGNEVHVTDFDYMYFNEAFYTAICCTGMATVGAFLTAMLVKNEYQKIHDKLLPMINDVN